MDEQMPKPPSPTQRRRGKVKRSLLDSGLKLMGSGSITGCKVEHITKQASVGKGTFFTHFASKEAFVADLVEMVLLDLARRVRPVGISPTDALSLISGVGAVHLRYFQLRPQAAGLLSQAVALDQRTEPGLAVTAHLDQYLGMVAQMIAPAAEQMGWPRERAAELALMLLSTACGFFWLGKNLGTGADTPADLLDRLGRALARGLGGVG